MAVQYCPYCGGKDPGDPCRHCGAGRTNPTSRNDRVERMQEALATPGRLTPEEWQRVRGNLVATLRQMAHEQNTGHQVARPIS